MITGFKLPLIDKFIVPGEKIRGNNSEIANLKNEISKQKESAEIWNKVQIRLMNKVEFLQQRLKRYEG